MTNKTSFTLFVCIIPLTRCFVHIKCYMSLQPIHIIRLTIKPMCISPRRPVTPVPRWVFQEASDPDVCILNKSLQEVIGAGIRHRGQVSNVVGNVLLAEPPGFVPRQPAGEMFVAASCGRVGDPVVLTNWNKVLDYLTYCMDFWVQLKNWAFVNQIENAMLGMKYGVYFYLLLHVAQTPDNSVVKKVSNNRTTTLNSTYPRVPVCWSYLLGHNQNPGFQPQFPGSRSSPRTLA